MRYYAYVSDSCQEDAQRTGHQAEVRDLAIRVERDQSIWVAGQRTPEAVPREG